MHWALLLVLTWVTAGIVGLVWVFKQAGFVRKIDPASKAKNLIAIAALGPVVMIVLVIGGIAMASRAPVLMGILSLVGMLVYFGCIALGIVAVFGMRTSLLRYYNTVEPMGLKLSAVMTFFSTCCISSTTCRASRSGSGPGSCAEAAARPNGTSARPGGADTGPARPEAR